MKFRFLIGLLVLGIAISFYCILPDPLFMEPYSSVCYSDEGRLLGGRIAEDEQWRFPPIDSLPQKYVESVTLFEDERFFYHPGVDVIAIGRAVKQNLAARKTISGASTITMQTMRLARGAHKRTWKQKIIELVLALRLECSYTKDEILKLYASHAPFGGNIVGVAAAAWRYYDKSPDNLTWAEAATLAVLPNAPALIHPGRNRQALKDKRDRLLYRLWKTGKINTSEYTLAVLEDVPFSPKVLPKTAYHLTEYLRNHKQNRTTIKKPIQDMLYQTVELFGNEFRQTGVENIGAIISETQTGAVLAYVGNVRNGQSETCVDMVKANRSSGSILKPFLHAALITEGKIAPKQLLEDTPISIAGFRPSNYDKSFDGAVFADEALQRSLNVPAVNNLQLFGISKFINLLNRIGLTSISKSEDHYGLSLILGGAEVNLWDLVSGYSAMGRSLLQYGDRNSMYCQEDYRPISIFDRPYVDTILSEQSLFSASSIWETFEAMRSLKRPSEEGDWTHFSSLSNIAWKTGTSYGHRDAWAVGINPKYTIGIWVGNSDGEGNKEIVGTSAAGRVLFSVVNQLPKVSEWFEKPYDDMREMAICPQSGHLAGPYCQKTQLIFVPESIERSTPCPYHEQVFIDKVSGLQVNSRCSDLDQMEQESWFSLPQAMAHYYKIGHSEYKDKPDFLPSCLENTSRKLAVLYPMPNEKIFLPKALSGEKQRLVCKASHSNQMDKLFWHLNNQYLGVTNEFHTMELMLNQGDYELTIMDVHGNTETQKFTLVGQ